MARPRKKLPPAKEHFIGFRLTDELYQVIAADAESTRLSVSEYCRQLATNRTIKYAPPIIHNDTAIVRELHSINKLGSNLNQIARYLNQGGNMTNPLAKEIRETLQVLNDSCNALNRRVEEEYGRY